MRSAPPDTSWQTLLPEAPQPAEVLCLPLTVKSSPPHVFLCSQRQAAFYGNFSFKGPHRKKQFYRCSIPAIIVREENNYYVSLIPAQRSNLKLHVTTLLFGHLVICLQKIPYLSHSCIAMKKDTFLFMQFKQLLVCCSSPLVLLGTNEGERVVDYMILESKQRSR